MTSPNIERAAKQKAIEHVKAAQSFLERAAYGDDGLMELDAEKLHPHFAIGAAKESLRHAMAALGMSR